MARNREFDDELDALKMLHDAKNHDYATDENPYKNLEKVSAIGIEPWKGIVIRLMDKFSRLEEYCVKGKLAIKSEGIQDTFADIAVYSILARILFRKEQEKQQELTELERGKGGEESYDVDRDNGLGISLTAGLNHLKESDIYKKALLHQAEKDKKAEDERIRKNREDYITAQNFDNNRMAQELQQEGEITSLFDK